MKKFLVGMAAAAALAVGTFAPQPAKAMDPISAWWLLPAFVGGLVVAGAYRPAYAAPRGAVYVNPANCRIVRERIRGGWREVEVCS